MLRAGFVHRTSEMNHTNGQQVASARQETGLFIDLALVGSFVI